MQGNAVTYATSPMGADHTAGNVVAEYVTGKLDPLKTEGQVAASRCLQCDLRLLFSKPVLPPRKQLWFELTQENVAAVPEVEGVYQLLDEQENVIYIKGAMNLRREIEEQLEVNEAARYFMYNEEPMYTKRESELIQQYLQVHGEMPGGGEGELDDLF